MNIRKAEKNDEKDIEEILTEADEHTAGMTLNDFWVAEDGGRPVGVVKLEDLGEFLFLSSLAVVKNRQRQGIAGKLMEHLLLLAGKDIYLYTIIPDFFKKFGFVKAGNEALFPKRSAMECERCEPDKCAAMVRKAGS